MRKVQALLVTWAALTVAGCAGQSSIEDVAPQSQIPKYEARLKEVEKQATALTGHVKDLELSVATLENRIASLEEHRGDQPESTPGCKLAVGGPIEGDTTGLSDLNFPLPGPAVVVDRQDKPVDEVLKQSTLLVVFDALGCSAVDVAGLFVSLVAWTPQPESVNGKYLDTWSFTAPGSGDYVNVSLMDSPSDLADPSLADGLTGPVALVHFEWLDSD